LAATLDLLLALGGDRGLDLCCQRVELRWASMSSRVRSSLREHEGQRASQQQRRERCEYEAQGA
jgi:hypothetical protein